MKIKNTVISLIMAGALAACGGETEPSPSSTGTPASGDSGSGSNSGGGTLTISDSVLSVGNTRTLSASGGSGSYTYSVYNGGSYVSLSGSVLTGISEGAAIIRVSDGSTTANATVTVKGAEELHVAGSATCAKITGGGIQCFGSAVGQYPSSVSSSAVSLSNFANATSLSTNFHDSTYHTFSCAVISGDVYCVGENSHGQLGDGTTIARSSPVGPSIAEDVIKIVVGYRHVCALTTVASGGIVYCWGGNGYKQVGAGINGSVVENPQFVTSSAVDIAAGPYHTCAVIGNGSLQCWGYNGDGQLGTGDMTNRNSPVTVLNNTYGVDKVSAGEQFTCATRSGDVYCWGTNFSYQLGTNESGLSEVIDATQARQVVNVSNVSKIVSGLNFTCALESNGHVKCWGYNLMGAIGIGAFSNKEIAPTVSSITGVSDIGAGAHHVCSYYADKSLKCWGGNAGGKLGHPTGSTYWLATPTVPASNWN